MRNSREATAKSRKRIVASAAKMFRARGVAAVGIAELMQAAGMTHGGFYKHFESKDALVAEACSFAMTQSAAALHRAVEKAHKGEELKAIVDAYLSRAHRDNPGSGCAIAALGGEVGNGNGNDAARQALAKGRANMIARFAQYWNGRDAKRRAATMAAMMVGAMVNARIAKSKGGDDILRAARRALYREIASS
jgi:TetR/AcrR family transcriptional regulator, transcriptional repressor for nem operon